MLRLIVVVALVLGAVSVAVADEKEACTVYQGDTAALIQSQASSIIKKNGVDADFETWCTKQGRQFTEDFGPIEDIVAGLKGVKVTREFSYAKLVSASTRLVASLSDDEAMKYLALIGDSSKLSSSMLQKQHKSKLQKQHKFKLSEGDRREIDMYFGGTLVAKERGTAVTGGALTMMMKDDKQFAKDDKRFKALYVALITGEVEEARKIINAVPNYALYGPKNGVLARCRSWWSHVEDGKQPVGAVGPEPKAGDNGSKKTKKINNDNRK
jgi:hypothetical protein